MSELDEIKQALRDHQEQVIDFLADLATGQVSK